MLDFFQGGMVPLALLFLGAVVLGGAIFYGVMRAGRIKGAERTQLDHNTRMRQADEDPQKRPT